MGCGLSKPQGVSRGSHFELQTRSGHRPNPSSRQSKREPSRHHSSGRGRTEPEAAGPKSSGGNVNLPPEQGPSRKENTNGQPIQEENNTQIPSKPKSLRESPAPASKARRSRRGGVRNARRRANRERREMEEALLDSIPEQRGSIIEQRAVDRRSMIDQPWRHVDFAVGETKGENTVVSDGEKHNGGQTRDSPTLGAQTNEGQNPIRKVDVTGAGSVPRKPVGGKAVKFDIPKKIPTEPKSDRLARERRDVSSSQPFLSASLKKGPNSERLSLQIEARLGEEACRRNFNGYNSAPDVQLPRLPDYKFGGDDWSLKESTKDDGSDNGNGESSHTKTDAFSLTPKKEILTAIEAKGASDIGKSDASHPTDAVVAERDTSTSTQTGGPPATTSSQDTRTSVDWYAIRRRMEARLGKSAHSEPKDKTGRTLPIDEDKGATKIEEPQRSGMVFEGASAGWSFNKVL